MRHLKLGNSGEDVSIIGQGTWGIGGYMSSDPSNDDEAIQSLRLGVELGMSFIDTAEIYGDKHGEEVVGKAIEDIREKTFVATKVSPNHFSYDDVLRSAKASLKRLKIKFIDLYQLHWPNLSISIRETMRALEKLVDIGEIRYIGVSNFSVEETKEAQASLSKNEIVSNQVEYHLLKRDIEHDLIPYCRKEHITVIAYKPLGRGEVTAGSGGARFSLLHEIASKYGRSSAQVALNWLISKPNVQAIPKAIREDHVRDNAVAADWQLQDEDVKRLDDAFR